MPGIDADEQQQSPMSGVHVFRFWGAMDALTLLTYVVTSLFRQRVPLYSDLVDFMNLQHAYGGSGSAFFIVSLGVFCSIAISAFLFLSLSRHARAFAYWQTPFRLLMAQPSLVFIPWIAQLTGYMPVALLAALLLLSEVLKIGTLYLTQDFPGDG